MASSGYGSAGGAAVNAVWGGVVFLILAMIGFALFAFVSMPHARRFALRQDKPAMRRRKYAGGSTLAAAFVPAIQSWG